MSFPGKKGFCQFLYSNYLLWCKKSEKNLKNFELLMDRQTENCDFIGPSVGQGSKKSNLEQNATLFERKK